MSCYKLNEILLKSLLEYEKTKPCGKSKLKQENFLRLRKSGFCFVQPFWLQEPSMQMFILMEGFAIFAFFSFRRERSEVY